ncbi:leucyl aminopeptidase family protein [Rhizobium sp. Leaf341]|uniref:leucyl aminopeptidase family protein n=1 Tax=Rhizobium sp. Leaf341 TaxID=1736344 RepID=UPI000714EA0C|nr:leucyl aminopeptidase family protein [Rhizobium sp. Leaf341]KQR78152.1 cytochrome C oxidase subunit II [Rhizobium sp. Leaf341]
MPPFCLEHRPSPFTSGEGAAPNAALPVYALTPDDLESAALDPFVRNWARQAGFKAESGALLLIPAHPDGQGGADGLGGALFGLGSTPFDAPFATGKLARTLPPGDWRIVSDSLSAEQAALGFALGAYSFDRYKVGKAERPQLKLPESVDRPALDRTVAGISLVRDLINTPTNDLGPDALEEAFQALGRHYGATVTTILGDDLLVKNFPLIHAVGRAAHQAPRLLDLRWGSGAKKITLVGKGVCFDTGGLDIKPAASMLLMKKDMGGAANVMGLALMIMDAGLDVSLRVLVPAVENSIAGNAFRPSDIYRSRKGLTVQIDNTDAEGRLVLADALAYAGESETDLLIDMATLTGAARVALGPDLPPFFTDDETLATDLSQASLATHDPLWRLPLYKGYEKDVTSRIADLTNAPSGGMAGAITAALFLKRFVAETRGWVHLDVYGWNPSERPHARVGGEAQGIRALYALIARDLS